MPNVRCFNLNYNFIEDLSPIGGGGVVNSDDGATSPNGNGLARLRKFTMVGGRVKSVRGVVGALRGLKELERVDLRCVPISDISCSCSPISSHFEASFASSSREEGLSSEREWGAKKGRD